MKQNNQTMPPQPTAELLRALDSGFTERRVAVGADGAQMAYRCGGGRGPLVVLLHGISSGAASWLPCASLLAADARVIAWDAPGYGNSQALPGAAPTAADYAQRLQALLHALDLRPDVIVGHSLGALMAAAYIAQAGPAQLPARLLLLSPAQGYGGPGKEGKAQEVARQRLDALAALGVEGLAERGPGRLLSAAASADAQAWVRWNMRRLDPDGYRQAVAMLCGDAIDDYLGRRAPGVSVWAGCGALDVVTPPPGCAALAERFGLPFELIPDAGHACYVEQARSVARWIRSGLAGYAI
ncbi:alpha/beta hydrolase [Cupriavidus basilensis]|uniref:Alpha/beta hydrolase n=1 Tax=Cupriavidus basilensis TaxID=68895 RepID=A0ABT6AXB9_9BURK|nr:alpha/beta hydrolase [Cupriavidus basilensis]MDF3836306.1 alpha/beta hydrolase [Cupriavidus basilensis]